jgi:hypothetical protein
MCMPVSLLVSIRIVIYYTDRYYNDVYHFSPAANTWTALSLSGSGPTPRYDAGFAATPDGILYVFGGWDGGNETGRAGYALKKKCIHYVYLYIYT